MSLSMEEREAFLSRSRRRANSGKTLGLPRFLGHSLGCTLAGSPGIFGTDPVNAVQQGGLSVF